MKRLSGRQIEEYERDGFVTVPDVLAPSLVEELHRASDAMTARAAAVADSDDVFDFGGPPDRPQLRRVKSPQRKDPAYAAALGAEEVLDCVEDLLGGAIRLWAGKLNLKQPHGGQAVEWHQDWAFGPATNDDLLTVGIALDDATTENGCLLAVPGSHRGPVLDHWRDGRFAGAVTEEAVDLKGAVPLAVRTGGITMHHIRTLHGSAPNRSAAQRRLLLYTYAAADAWPLVGVPDMTAFNAEMLRGALPAAPRLERVPVAPWPRWDEEELGGDTSIFDFQDRSGVSLLADVADVAGERPRASRLGRGERPTMYMARP